MEQQTNESEVLTLLRQDVLDQLVAAVAESKVQESQAGYNLFTLSTRTGLHEDFHSDVIASLLNPQGLHGENDKFLRLFLIFLQEHFKINLAYDDYCHATVHRETARLDIWIRDEKSKKAIIIENKINGAVDQHEQLRRYFEHCKKFGYKVEAIIYLSLNGLKIAEKFGEEIDSLVQNIGAVTGKPTDLLHGWIEPCKAEAKTDDSKSVLHQYGKLLRYLNKDNLMETTLDSFYQFASANNALNKIETIINLYDKLPEYRTSQFVSIIGNDYAPFTKPGLYKPNHMCYDFFRDGANSFKLDVSFDTDGSARVCFWNPPMSETDRKLTVAQKLKEIDVFQDFEEEPRFGYARYFTLSPDYPSLEDIDKAVCNFVIAFMHKLRAKPE